MASCSKAASLGCLAESYLVSHGYTRETIQAITTAAHTSTSASAFAEVLSAHGYPRMEAEWLWDIIDHNIQHIEDNIDIWSVDN